MTEGGRLTRGAVQLVAHLISGRTPWVKTPSTLSQASLLQQRYHPYSNAGRESVKVSNHTGGPRQRPDQTFGNVLLELVIRDHLATEQRATDELRDQCINGLKTKLLEPLRGRLHEHVSSMFPEIEIIELLPQVRSLDETLSSVGIEFGDPATTVLTGKGTGLRGAVLVAMLRYLAEQSKRPRVLAVEEPEAFLHPGAQELIAGQLEDLAARLEVSLLVTTHSPHILSRKSNARVTELRKDADGTTSLAATARGEEDQAELLGSLFTDAGFARVLDRATSIPAGTRAVVVTEGYTDGEFLRYGLAAAGQLNLIEGIYFVVAGGANKASVQAILNWSATELSFRCSPSWTTTNTGVRQRRRSTGSDGGRTSRSSPSRSGPAGVQT